MRGRNTCYTANDLVGHFIKKDQRVQRFEVLQWTPPLRYPSFISILSVSTLALREGGEEESTLFFIFFTFLWIFMYCKT